jgi:DNA integrity scanning protein DisA with diadenylate cyclase activity
MKIIKIADLDLMGDKIIVEVEGYPHAQPVFDAKITPEELEVALKAWKVNQDAVDALNTSRQAETKVEPVLSAELKAMEGKVIEDKPIEDIKPIEEPIK